ncbi:MAG: hypothetical protein ACOYBT_01015 [Polynucleobacter sp.]
MNQVLQEQKFDFGSAKSIKTVDAKECLRFDAQQAELLNQFALEMAKFGGPQRAGANSKASMAATEIKILLSAPQRGVLSAFARGELAAVLFEGLLTSENEIIPKELPPLQELEDSRLTLYLASRSQILLKLVEHNAFAYDFDNNGKIVRLVGNFKGGGVNKVREELNVIELSSHSGLALGPHTEAPYWCSVRSDGSHSPAPSSLILTAMYNPQKEPTSVIPIRPILEGIGSVNTLALTTNHFNFTRSDSFVAGTGEAGKNVSMIEFDEHLGFVIRYNAYRFSVSEDAPHSVKKAFGSFTDAVANFKPTTYTLSSSNALVINNDIALHCRDIIQDNRRLLVRIFGSSRSAKMLTVSPDPILAVGG